MNGIKRPTYLTNPLLPERLICHNPNIKVIAILRNPKNRFISAYYHVVKSGYLDPLPLSKFLELFLDNKKMMLRHPRIEALFSYGLYAKGLKNYIDRLDYQNIKIMFIDDLKKDRDLFFGEIYRKLLYLILNLNYQVGFDK